MSTDIELQLDAEPASVAVARQSLSKLAGQVPSERLEVLRLLVSELVTNSILHARSEAGGRIGVRVQTSPWVVRAEVRDSGTGFELPDPVPEEDLSSGWGLYFIDTLADRWGTYRSTSTCVWFEMDRAAGR